MKLLTSIIAVLGILITIAFTITPVGMLTVAPALITIICGLILLKMYKQDGNSTTFPKVLIGLAILGAVTSSARSLFTTDKIATDVQFEERKEKSKEEAVEELEELEELD